jgi:protein TonB
VFVHILLLGSAIAVAGYGGGMVRSPHGHILVSLVDLGSGPDAGVSRSVGRQRPQDTSKPVKELTVQAMVVQSPFGEAAQGERSDQDARDAATINAADMQQEATSASGTGQVSGIGTISAEQWAIIESQIERAKKYPRFARERGIQGVVHVRFKLKPTGDVDQVEISKSSGYDVLDTASVKTVYRAAPMPYVSGWVNVPITYMVK